MRIVDALRQNARGLVVGALAMLLALEVVFLLSVLGLVPFAPYALALAVVDVTPGTVSTVLIDLLQFWAKRLLEAGVLTFTVALGAIAGVLFARGRSWRGTLGVAAIPWTLNVGGAVLFSSRQFDATGTAVAGLVGVGAYGLAVRAMRGSLATSTPDPARRRALLGAGAVALVLGVGGMWLGSVMRRSAEMVARALELRRPLAIAVPSFALEDPAFEATPGLSPQLTKNADFYVVDTALYFKPTVDVSTWKLMIDGEVEAPYELTYDQLLSDFDPIEQVETLECISNPVGGDLVSTAKWVGVRVADLLHRARVKSTAYDLVSTSVDDYTDSIPIQKALEATTLLAYGMNGDVLPVDHGYPARLLVPNIYGMKNVKWVRRLTVANFDYQGYWQERGWNDTAVIVTNARIDVPNTRVRWSGGPVRIAGVAFAGSRGIKTVEVSTDKGKTWSPATLGREVNPFTWRRWIFEWTPSGPGDVTLAVRAVDGQDVPQVSLEREPYPSGATGYHRVGIHIDQA